MIVKLDNITKTYQNSTSDISREVLKNISFSVSKGDSYSIVGPSGCGKSTLLNIMGTLDNPTSGKVYFKENEIDDLKPDRLAEIRNQNIGFIFQQHHLLPQLSLLENVLVPVIIEKDKAKRDAATNRAMQLLEMVGLADKTDQLPVQLSVGECQRTAVVRALINQPELVLADEPTGSLDEESAINLVDLLCKINSEQNIAVVMVTHSLELAAKMKVIYKLAGGELKQT